MKETLKKNRFIIILVWLLVCFYLSLLVNAEEETLNPQPALTPKLVSNIWIDEPLSQVLRDISTQLHITITVDPSVGDSLISLETDNMTLDECLNKISIGQGLVVKKINDNFYIVGNGQPGSILFDKLVEIQPVSLKYISARHLLDILPKDLVGYVTKGERNTEALIYAPTEKLNQIMDIIRKVDVPIPQVVLEALVIELTDERGSEFSMDWERMGSKTFFSLKNAGELFTGTAAYTSIPENEVRNFILSLRMLVSKGLATIRSRPRVATLNGEQATIDVSLEEYYNIIKDINGTFLRTELQVIKSGVVLKMTPQIGDEGDITVNVSTEIGDVIGRNTNVKGYEQNSAGELPAVRRRKAETKVRVKDGDAIVIGGLVETHENTSIRQVPILGSIPVVGILFRKTVKTNVEKEVVIFITPRIMKPGSSPLADRHKFFDIEEEISNMGSNNKPNPSDSNKNTY